MVRASSVRLACLCLLCAVGTNFLGCPSTATRWDQRGWAIAARPEGGYWIAGEDGSTYASSLLVLGLNANLVESSRTEINSNLTHFWPTQHPPSMISILENGNLRVAGNADSVNPTIYSVYLTELRPDGSVVALETMPGLIANVIRFYAPASFLIITSAGDAAWVHTSGYVHWTFASTSFRFLDGLRIGEEIYLLGTARSSEEGRRTDLFQLDSNGALVRQVRVGNNVSLRTLLSTVDGRFVSMGDTDADEGSQSCFVVFDAEGTVLRLTEFPDFNLTGLQQLVAAPGGGYAILGSAEDEQRFPKAALLKVDEDGNEQWRQVYESNAADTPAAILALPEGFAITGAAHAIGTPDDDVLLLITNNEGDLLRRMVYREPES